jgi:MFS family permease
MAIRNNSRLLSLYMAEAVNSISGTLLTVGLPFYTSHRFGWGAKENFAVAACQGALYVCGALSAKRISRRWGRAASLLSLCAGMTVLALAVGISAAHLWAIPTALLVAIETGLMGTSWPMLESLVSAAGQSSQLSRRLGIYNITWASSGAIALAASGAIIQHAPAWAFFGTIAAGHLIAGLLVFRCTQLAMVRPDSPTLAQPPASLDAKQSGAQQALLDADIVCRHRLALWLSRIALPSTYVIIYSLAPLFPALHAIKQLSPTTATLLASIWLIARAAAFIITGNTTFWHKRPILMLFASITMLFAFLGAVIPGALTGIDLPKALLAMAIAQIVLGFSIGTIYSASLYFGMVVSEGSTEHGGYHEALIGLGQILGPIVGTTMQWVHPGPLWPAVLGISTVVAVTIVIEAIAGIRISGGKRTSATGEGQAITEIVPRDPDRLE